MTMTVRRLQRLGSRSNAISTMSWSSLVLLICLVSVCRGQYLYKEGPHASNSIKEYEGESPDDFFDFDSKGLVEFYSPHCGHCQQFAAAYVELAKRTQERDPNIRFYSVSCASHLDYCRKVVVKGYPSFFKIDGEKREPQYVKSGTRGVDIDFVVSLFDTAHSAAEDTPHQLMSIVTDMKQKAAALPAVSPEVLFLGAGRLNVQTGKVEELPSVGATEAMKANIKGTPEDLQRRQAILESIRRAKGRRKAEQVKTLMETSDVLPFRKVVPVVQMREKIPFIKAAKLSLEEELIIDTAVSFAYSLQHDVFLKGEQLSEIETKALKDWLILLSVSLPQEWVLTTLVDDVLRQVDELAKDPKLLSRILKNHQIVRTRWSPSCGGRDGRFTCGFWKLLHTVSVGVAEHRGGKTVFSQSFNAFSPVETADIIREFIANFFRCRDCAAHFLARYADCSFERCDRLVDDADAASDSDWKQLAIYLWKFHNSVNVRVWNERHNNGLKKPEEEIRLVWPTLADCWTCYRDDGTWDEDAIFLQLERSYWPGAEIDSRTARLLSFASQIQPPHSIKTYAVLCVLILLLGYRSASSYFKGAIYGRKRAD